MLLERRDLLAGAAALALLGAAGCGLDLLDYTPGGADQLPTLGAGPYRKLPLDIQTPVDEPYVLLDQAADLADPEVRPRRGGGFRIWFSRRGGDEESIHYAELPALAELPDLGPVPALVADQGWEEGRVAAPAVLEQGGLLLLYYEGGVGIPSVGLAISEDDGETWVKHPGNPVIERLGKPAAALLYDQVAIYGEEPARGGGSIVLLVSDDGLGFGERRVVLSPGPPGGFDARAVRDPFAVATVKDGRLHVGLFYVGESLRSDATLAAIGYAGSFDGEVFERFAGGEPVLEAFPPSERGPSAVLEPGGGLLFFSEPRGPRLQLAAARHP